MQIDEQVLQALPDDIRSNIEEALQKKHQRDEIGGDVRVDEAKHRQATDEYLIEDGEQPSCSHWTDNDRPAAEAVTSASTKCSVSQLSRSQVVLFRTVDACHQLY